MATVNQPNPGNDLTVRVFDSYQRFDVLVDSSDYELVNSFFKSVSNNSSTVDSLTTALFEISTRNNISVQTLLEQIKGQNAIQINSTLAYYLNAIRSPATLVGVNSPITPNFYAARNVKP